MLSKSKSETSCCMILVLLCVLTCESKKKKHKNEQDRFGGLVVVVALIGGMMQYYRYDDMSSKRPQESRAYACLLSQAAPKDFTAAYVCLPLLSILYEVSTRLVLLHNVPNIQQAQPRGLNGGAMKPKTLAQTSAP